MTPRQTVTNQAVTMLALVTQKARGRNLEARQGKRIEKEDREETPLSHDKDKFCLQFSSTQEILRWHMSMQIFS